MLSNFEKNKPLNFFITLYLFSLMTPIIGVQIPLIGTLKLSMILSFVFLLIGLFLKVKFRLAPFFFLFVFFIVYSITGIWSYEYMGSVVGVIGIIQLFIYVFSFIIILSIKGETGINYNIVSAIVIFIILNISYYIVGVITYNGSYIENTKHFGMMIDRGMIRARGLTNDPNILSLYLGICFIYIQQCALFKIKYKNTILLLIITLFFLTISRGGIIALLLSYSIVFVIELLKMKKNILYLIIGGGLGVILFIYMYHYDDVVNEIVNKRLDNISTGSGRFHLWDFALSKINESPIFGHGVFTTKYIFIELLGKVGYSHNSIIEIFMEGGFFLFISFFVLFINVLLKAVKNIYRNSWMLPVLCFITVQYMTLSLIFNEFIYFIYVLILFTHKKISFSRAE